MKNVFLVLISLFILSTSYSQVIVTGIITDDNADGLPGATVQIKNVQGGTITDFDGKFTITAPDSTSVIQISYIGMETIELTAKQAIEKFGNPGNLNLNDTIKQINRKTFDPKESLNKYLNSLENGRICSPFMYAYGSDTTKKVDLPLKETNVEVNIAGVIADVVVKQIYVNKTKDTIDGIYVFPGSTQSAVYAMNMKIGDRTIYAQIKEKDDARQIYNQAKAEGRTASLLEQHRPNVFQMNVANILPGETVIIEFRYSELISALNGEYEFLFPRIVGPRYSTTNETWINKQAEQNGADINFDIKINIQAPIPIKEVTSDSLKINIEKISEKNVSVTIDKAEQKLKKEDVIIKYRLRGDKVESGIMTYEHGDENFFLLMMEPPKEVKKEQVPPREYILIMDVSGSMFGFPIETSKKLLTKLAETFDSTDVFNIVQFAGGTNVFSEKSVHATKTNIDKVNEFIARPEGSGSTNLLPALEKAFELRVDSGYSTTFIIATDGYVTAEKEAFSFIRENLKDANVFSFGIGNFVNHFLLEGVAYAGMGDKYVVTNQSEANEISDGLIEQIKNPVLTDIKTDFSGVEIYDVEPAAIHDVFSNRPIALCGKYKNNTEGNITISGKSGSNYITETYKLDSGKKSEALRYLWAREQIKYLSDYACYFENDYASSNIVSSESKQKITDLGLKYNLLTNYTSFVAVDSAENVETKCDTLALDAGWSIPFAQNDYSKTNVNYGRPGAASYVTMSSSNSEIEGVTVIAYGEKKAEAITGSVSTMGREKIEDFPVLFFPPNNVFPGVYVLRGDNLFPDDYRFIRINGISGVLNSTYPGIMADNINIGKNYITDNFMINSNNFNNPFPIHPLFVDRLTVYKSGFLPSTSETVENATLQIDTKKASKGFYINFESKTSIDMPGILPGGVNAKSHYFKNKGFTASNSILVNKGTERYKVNFTASNVKQNTYIPGTTNSINNLGFYGKILFTYKSSLESQIFFVNTNVRGLPRFSGNTGLLYSIINSTPENTDSIINNSKSDYSSNLFIPSLKYEYSFTDNLKFTYKVFADFNESVRSDKFMPEFSEFQDGHEFNIENKSRKLYNNPGLRFEKNFNHRNNIKAGLFSNFVICDENRILNENIIRTGEKKELPYDLSYKKNTLNTFFDYDYKEKLYFHAGYSSNYNDLYSGKLKNTNNFSVSSRFDYTKLNFLQPIQRVYSANIRLFYDNTQAVPPVFISPTTLFAENFKGTDLLYVNELFPASYKVGIKPENMQKFTLIHNAEIFRKLNFYVELYIAKTSNLFMPLDIKNYIIENNGHILRKGFNAEVSYDIYRSNLMFRNSLIFSKVSSTVSNLSGNTPVLLAGIEGVKSYAQNGEELGILMSDRGEVGNPNPDFILSYIVSCGFKKFTFSILSELKKGGDMWYAQTNTIQDASLLKIRQLKLEYNFKLNSPKFAKFSKFSLFIYANNIITLTKYPGTSPDSNFFGNTNSSGIDYYNMPDIKSIGFGLNLTF